MPRMFVQFSPTMLPITIKTVFQIVEPVMVYIKNFPIGISLIPAGIDIKLLTIGINLQKNTVLFPLLSNHASALSISSYFILKTLPILPDTIFLRRSLFNILPI